jgi:transposase-like protein
VIDFTSRKVIYTTNAIESINMSLRKVIKTRASFPTDASTFGHLTQWPRLNKLRFDSNT